MDRRNNVQLSVSGSKLTASYCQRKLGGEIHKSAKTGPNKSLHAKPLTLKIALAPPLLKMGAKELASFLKGGGSFDIAHKAGDHYYVLLAPEDNVTDDNVAKGDDSLYDLVKRCLCDCGELYCGNTMASLLGALFEKDDICDYCGKRHG
jgi:hypothetical protein